MTQTKSTYWPPEIYKYIASYVSGIDKIKFMSTNKTARDALKIYKVNCNKTSSLITQEFIDSEPMKYCQELNINRNKNITCLKNLRDLRILYCRHTNLKVADIARENIEILECKGSKINDLVAFPKLRRIDLDITDYEIHQFPCATWHCLTSLLWTPILALVTFVSLLTCILVYTLLLMPQNNVQQNYIETNATFISRSETYDCRNCYKTWNDYPGGPSCSSMPANLLNVTGQIFCSLPGACYVYWKPCKKCFKVCKVYLAAPQCRISPEACTGSAQYSYNVSRSIYSAMLPINYGDHLNNTISVFYDYRDPKKYILEYTIRTEYSSIVIASLIVGLVSLIAMHCCIGLCIISWCHFNHLLKSNHKKIKQINCAERNKSTI